MSGVEEYLQEVRSAMAGMDPRVREDILAELHSHLADSAAANGGDVGRAIEAMGPAARVGREYRALYGYSTVYRSVFVLIAAVLAALTVPVLQGAQSSFGNPYYLPNLLALPFLVVLVGWLLWISVAAGSRAGLFAGLAAGLVRIGVVAFLVLGPTNGLVTADGAAVLAISSALLVLEGWLPGTAKQVWSRPTAEL